MFLISSRFSTVRRFRLPLAAASFLALFVLLLFYRLLFTDRVLASGDILHYFYPYRDYAAAALRAGRIPFWNPYIFMGAPFLANPQAAALYPLHWPLSWLPVTRQLYWSGAIHAWILALGGCALMRRWGAGWLAAVGTGVVLAGSGFYGGLLGHINQMNGAAWLPWLLWALEGRWASEERAKRSEEREGVTGSSRLASHFWRYAALLLPFALFVALTLLAGHTQTTYINLFGVGAWLLATSLRAYSYGFRLLAASFLIYALGVLLGVMLAAAQLLPTLELSQLGLRSGGLSYVDVTSFSLRPLLLHWTLLPSYGMRDLSVVFSTLGYTEFVAYVGVAGLLLALVAVASRLRPAAGRRPWTFGHWPLAALCGLFFAGLGLFLALGRWNPFSLLFYYLIPGFDLFRTPARWMMLYTLGMAVLAGAGTEWIWGRLKAANGGRAVAQRLSRAGGAALLTILALDLFLAARALPHTQPTAPQAVYDVRTASAHLLTEPQRALHPAAAGRLLSISEITFDPGDMPDWRRILRGGARPQLSEAAFEEFIIALKSQEILAPNLSLLWRIPTVDGFDGGVLPLLRYNAFLSLLIPPAELVPDGRVREQLRTVPPADTLELMDVRFVITDKVRDVWYDDVYYDRQIGATLAANVKADSVGVGARLTVQAPHSFEATAVDVVGFMTAGSETLQTEAANLPLAEITALIGDERHAIGRLLTGSQAGSFKVAVGSAATATGRDAPVISQEGETGQQEYLARFTLTEAARLDALEVALVESTASAKLAVQAVTLVDERTKTFVPLLPSDRGRFRRVHSGDVKIYERLGGSERAQLIGAVRPAASLDEALRMLRASDVKNASQASAVVETSAEAVAAWGLVDRSSAPSGSEVAVVSYEPERVVVHARSERPSFLLLKDAYYPGWQAAVNGEPVEVVATNVLFRGVPVPAGESEVIFSYRPTTWRTGLRLSLAGGLLWLLMAALTCGRTWRRNS
ncbi:MAG: YfhO family protein [Caldilineaceae bacterium]|nr:YfhO family protein [Caldilineaceae bacterium]